MMHSDEAPCEACKLASRACKFEHVGVKREKPPSMRYVSNLIFREYILREREKRFSYTYEHTMVGLTGKSNSCNEKLLNSKPSWPG
jgi:hypothetical protein